MKSSNVFCFPLNFSEIGVDGASTLGIVPTPDKFDDIFFSLPVGAKFLAPHDGLVTDRGVDLLIENDKNFGSIFYNFNIDNKFVKSTKAVVKKGDVIGYSQGAGAWKSYVIVDKVSRDVNPLILAGILGGLDYPGILNATGYADDIKKFYNKLTSSIATHVAAFGVGWLFGKK